MRNIIFTYIFKGLLGKKAGKFFYLKKSSHLNVNENSLKFFYD